jgi:hypothetical protein
LAIRAAVGTPRETDEAAPLAAIAPVVSAPCATPYTSPSAASSGVTSRVPPVRSVASPSAETATSIRPPGQIVRDDLGGLVLGRELGLLVARVHAEALQHPDQRLPGEHGVVQLVAGAVQPHDEPVADELVDAHALDVRDVLHPHLRRRRCGEAQP